MSIRDAFLAMVSADPYNEPLQTEPATDKFGSIIVKFEEGINPLLTPFLNPHRKKAVDELIDYLSTSQPSSDYESYMWTFCGVDQMVCLLSDTDLLERGYFPFAYSGSNFAGVSLHDGKIYSSYTCDQQEYEAKSITDFIGKSRQDWLNHDMNA